VTHYTTTNDLIGVLDRRELVANKKKDIIVSTWPVHKNDQNAKNDTIDEPSEHKSIIHVAFAFGIGVSSKQTQFLSIHRNEANVLCL
jgi:hypothetical protein